MRLAVSEQDPLLMVALGFAVFVVLLHLGETVVLAVRLRAWMLICWSGLLFVLAVLFLVWQLSLRVENGLHLTDLLSVLGVQLGLLVCLPSRWLRRRKCQWERTRAQAQKIWWHPIDTPPHARRFRMDRWNTQGAGVAPRTK